MAVLAILVGAWMWWRCRRSSREESHKLEEGEHWLELPASDALSGDSDGKAFLPGAAAALGGCVLSGTFLAKSAGAGLEALLAAGEAVPGVGAVAPVSNAWKGAHGGDRLCPYEAEGPAGSGKRRAASLTV